MAGNLRVVEINTMVDGSTGRIMRGLAEVSEEKGIEVHTFSPMGRSQKTDYHRHHFIGTIFERRVCELINTHTGKQGHLNIIGTMLMIRKIQKLRPKVIHLHNLYSNFLNMKMLFNYIKKNHVKVIWTFHDCWPFTGQCPYFDIVQCSKWKTECDKCPMINQYPISKVDRSKKNFHEKKNLYSEMENVTIVTPSEWLADLTRQSFMKKHNIKVINNGIDTSGFKPVVSDFREKYGIKNKFIILGVSFAWGYRKGLDRFEKLAEKIDDRFIIVLVGMKTSNYAKDKIITIPRTDSVSELAEIYSAADVLLNPTREDNYPTINIEALCCGTPVLSYGAGGSAEVLTEDCGMVVNDGNVYDIMQRLREKNFDIRKCVERGREFDQRDRFLEYVELYENIIKD